MTHPYFYDQTTFRKVPKRFRKTPEELPTSLRFAHLNPKVAAYLKNQESQKENANKDENLGGDDGNRPGSLLPNINQAFRNILRYDDLSDDDDEESRDTQRLMLEQWKFEALNLLGELEKLLNIFESTGYAPILPDPLELQLQCSFKELTVDVKYMWREWQLPANKDGWIPPPKSDIFSKSSVRHDDALSRSGANYSPDPDDAASRPRANDELPTISESKKGRRNPEGKNKLDKYRLQHLGAGDGPASGRSRSSRSRTKYIHGRGRKSLYAPSEGDASTTSCKSAVRGSVNAGPQPYFMSVIQFQLSSPQCEEKGWIVHPVASVAAEEEQVDKKNAVLEWATKKLQASLKQSKEQHEEEKEKGFNKPIVIRYYGDNRKDGTGLPRKIGKPKPTLTKGQKPRMPQYPEEKENANKRKLIVTINDGSTVVYYPSGRQAIVMSRSGRGKDNFYTSVFNDNGQVMAVFTPTGRGTVYHDNGAVKFCAMDHGGTVQELDGSISKKWKWPPSSARIPAPIVIQINDNITFRCQNQSAMHVFYSCMKENLKFSVGSTQEISEQEENESGQLQSGYLFSSESSRILVKSRKYQQAHGNKRAGATSSISKARLKGRSSLIHDGRLSVRSMSPGFGSKRMLSDKMKVDERDELKEEKEKPAPFENENEKHLHKLRGKVRLLVDQWMEFYRIATGMTSPRIKVGKAATRDINSAKSSPGNVQFVPQSPATAVPTPTIENRAPSAPAGRVYRDRPASSATDGDQSDPAPGVTFDDNVQELEFEEEPVEKAPLSAKFRSPTPSTARSQRRPSTVSKNLPNFSLPTRTWSPPRGSCPIALRHELIGELRVACKCSRHVVPYITDIEYDEFILKAPSKQLVVISVISSLFPDANAAENMIEKIYSERNKNRTRPCLQSRSDPFRLLKYDIASAAFDSDHSQPMLLSRHNVVPGMFLVYDTGSLIFCDHIFNGYGNAKKDFQKQMMQCRRQSSRGHSLPRDFRFSPLRGRHGPRSAWGGQIGGAGVDSYGNPGTTIDSTYMTKKADLAYTESSDSQSQPPEYNYSPDLPIPRMLNFKLAQSAHQFKRKDADSSTLQALTQGHSRNRPSRGYGRHVESARS